MEYGYIGAGASNTNSRVQQKRTNINENKAPARSNTRGSAKLDELVAKRNLRNATRSNVNKSPTVELEGGGRGNLRNLRSRNKVEEVIEEDDEGYEEDDYEDEYEAADFYDITKQYNEENGLPMDSPLRDHDYDNPYSDANDHMIAEEDEMLQKIIQESLKESNRQGNKKY